jgi:hypothetical protein
MEGITRLVSESLARHGFDRPLDYRRLHWSRWFRCESPHSLLFVPSKPGVFALAEEIMDLAPGTSPVGADALACPERSRRVRLAERNSAEPLGGAALQRCDPLQELTAASAAEVAQRRMLAVTQFFEDDDMAFVLDRMLARQNPLRARLTSGRYFVRFVVIEDESQRRSICNALNQWIVNSAEKASGIGSHFASSLELTPATEFVSEVNDAQATLFADLTASREGHDLSRAEKGTQSLPALAAAGIASAATLPRPGEKSSITQAASSTTAPQLDSGAAANIHCPSPFPSGF